MASVELNCGIETKAVFTRDAASPPVHLRSLDAVSAKEMFLLSHANRESAQARRLAGGRCICRGRKLGRKLGHMLHPYTRPMAVANAHGCIGQPVWSSLSLRRVWTNSSLFEADSGPAWGTNYCAGSGVER